MLLSLLSPAFALTVPLRVTFSEDALPGETTAASSARTATVALSTATGTPFRVRSNELTVNRRAAGGSGPLSFAGDPVRSLRTWAVYLLDAQGAPIADPQIVDVLFDEAGNGAIAARGSGGHVASLDVSSDATGVATARVELEDVSAAFVGLAEISSDGDRLYSDPDMSILDATAYAAFLSLGLDAVLAVDHSTIQLDGNLDVTGLTVADDGTVQGGAALQWDLTFYDGRAVYDCPKGQACVTNPVIVGTASYTSAIGKAKKKKATEVPRVALKPSDQTFDNWDAGFSLTIEGDARGLELGASLETYNRAVAMGAADVVALDPSGIGVTWASKDKDDDDDDTGMIVDIFIDTDCEDCGDYDFAVPNPANPPPWVHIAEQAIFVEVLDSAGRSVGTHTCEMRPTASTQAGTAEVDTLVGDCTRDVAGTEVRRLRAEVGPHGTSTWSVEMAGPAFTGESSVTSCEKGGGCTTTKSSVLGGSITLSTEDTRFLSRPLAVADTSFDLPFSFAADADGLDANLTIELLDPTRALVWSVADDVLVGKAGDVTAYTIDLEDLELASNGLYSTPRDVVLSSRVEGSTAVLESTKALRLKR